MLATEVIARKRDGYSHSRDELDFLIHGITAGTVPDYQASAWLMAVYVRGMSHEETVDLSQAMAASGEVLDLQARWPNVVDKHSTGGVGDKTSLALIPMLAAAGCRVGKMSGRGLGFSGGTIDKLESISGLSCDLSTRQFLDQIERLGLVIASPSADLAPADGRLYALRDVTATVDSLPLIAASIMSKKLACRASVLVLDVKVGEGAFMRTFEDAHALAEMMVAIGVASGVRAAAVISDMSQPEGYAIGNALEVREAVDVLQGRGPADVVGLCSTLASAIGIESIERTIASGAAFEKLCQMVAAQGGDVRMLEDPSLLPSARFVRPLLAARSGYVQSIDAGIAGRVSVALGAGRQRKGEPVDPAVGLVLRAKVGAAVSAGEPLIEVHANDESKLEQALAALPPAYAFSDQPVAAPAQVKAIISPP